MQHYDATNMDDARGVVVSPDGNFAYVGDPPFRQACCCGRGSIQLVFKRQLHIQGGRVDHPVVIRVRHK